MPERSRQGGARPTEGRRRLLTVGAVRMRRFLMRRPHLRRAAHWALRVVDDLPSWAQAPFDPIRKQLLRDSGPAQLLTVVDALEAAGVPYWVAGGWGVDVLLGRQTRMHRDLDIVVDRFDTNEPRARRALETIGYRHIKFDRGGIWMPLRSTLDDESGHKVELMGIDWSRLTGRGGLPPGAKVGLQSLPPLPQRSLPRVPWMAAGSPACQRRRSSFSIRASNSSRQVDTTSSSLGLISLRRAVTSPSTTVRMVCNRLDRATGPVSTSRDGHVSGEEARPTLPTTDRGRFLMRPRARATD